MIIAYDLILTIAKITLRLELKLGQGPTYSINGSFGSPEKKIGINFTKANVKVCSSLHYSAVYSYLSVNGQEIF